MVLSNRTEGFIQSQFEPQAAARSPELRSLATADGLVWDAVEADAIHRSGPGDPVAAWADLIAGRLETVRVASTLGKAYLIARAVEGEARRGRGISDEEAAIVLRVLCGEQQKVVAFELDIAASTVSTRYVRGRDALDLSPQTPSLPLVVLAQHVASGTRGMLPNVTPFEHLSGKYVVVSVPRPNTLGLTQLTEAARDVARFLMDGYTRVEIAQLRKASVHTVGRQIHSVFTVLDVSGRCGLIREALRLGCFAAAGAPGLS